MIYILFSCNEWKSYDSMRVIATSTNLSTLKSIIKKEVGDNQIELNEGVDFQDIENSSVQDLNNRLTYAFIQECFDGEIL